jgi:hypothetical protein
MMFTVRWEETALNELTALWMQANSATRRSITAATNQIDYQLRTNPLADSESRSGGRRIRFFPPLGIYFRMEADGSTVSVLRVWLFRSRS